MQLTKGARNPYAAYVLKICYTFTSNPICGGVQATKLVQFLNKSNIFRNNDGEN